MFFCFCFFCCCFFVLERSALCINDHRTQNQSLKQAPLAFYEKFPVWKSCHFGRHFKKRSYQTDRCIARTNRYRALPESAFLKQLTPGSHVSRVIKECQLKSCLEVFTQDCYSLHYRRLQEASDGRVISAPTFGSWRLGFETRWGQNLAHDLWRFTAKSLSLSHFHRLDMT